MDKGPTRFNISKHAAPVDTRATWENLGPLPSSEQAHLRGIIAEMQPALSGKQGARATVLFAGPDRALMLMAAEVLAKDLKRPLYRIDLSAVVSEYIGETEKNLERLFDAAENRNWILFFDEADALFGKRSEVRDAHDRYANLEINYLLQRIEKYAGLVIVASNARDSIDEAFLRRLRFVVKFPMPAPGDRKKGWQNVCPAETPRKAASQMTYPGVYVQELSDPGKGRIIGAETGIAAFLGTAPQGPLGAAETALSWEDFQRIYGTSSSASSFLSPAVQGFFENGGKKCIVLRVADTGTDDAFLAGLALLWNVELNILSAPGIVSDPVQQALLDHCANAQDRICILDPPRGATVPEVISKRSRLSSSGGFGALYYPWLMAAGKSIPPGGHIAGVYARTGVQKAPAPAGIAAVLSGVTGVERQITDAEKASLNPKGVNIIRTLPGSSGAVVWGSRTLSDDPQWKYVPIRRYCSYLERSIDKGTQWVVLEPNDETTWARVRGSVSGFLMECWRSGALQGTTREQAFFVKCDRTTMTAEDIAAGTLICEIGVALAKPAEFMIIRIQQTSPASQ